MSGDIPSCIKDIHHASNYIEAIISALMRIRASVMTRFVESNYRVSNIANEKEESERLSLLGRYCAKFSEADAQISTELSSIELMIRNADAFLDSAYDDCQTSISKLNTALASAQSELRRFQERIKEHNQSDADVRSRVWAITNGKCFYCDSEIAIEDFHVDHIVPKSAGGPDHFSNYVPACAKCNISKNDKPFASFFLKKRRGEEEPKFLEAAE